MNEETRYVKIVEWSEQDKCFIGSCPELFYGGCHGDNEHRVFNELCHIVEETINLYRRDNKPLPSPLSGREFVNALHKVT
jgi:predicted RNase H-like HicB family nuclease